MRKKLHMIGNAHIDAVWLWRWQEGFQEVKATFQSALDRMKEEPDFKFTQSSTLFLEWVEKNNPAMFAEIKQRVAEGRWELVSGWLIEPDCNVPSGESYVRQGLYGQRYLQSRFGKTATTAFNIDSFGHNGALPQILNKSGIDSYVFLRPMPNEKALPARTFRWVGMDGSELLAYRIPYEYLSWGKQLREHLERFGTELTENLDELMFLYGVGNHGGGPTKENIKSIQALNADLNNPEMVFSTTRAFFDYANQNRDKLDSVYGDLQHHAIGCYSAHSGIKSLNRKAENALLLSEKWSTIAAAVKQQPYPQNFERGWKQLLFSQFHDTMAGTSIIDAYDDARVAIGESINIAQENENYAIQALSWDINIPQEDNMYPIVVFNPHGWDSRVPVALEVRGLGKEPFELRDDMGVPVRAQTIQSQSVTASKRLLFVADLPAGGYRTYKLFVKQERSTVFSPVAATQYTLENSRFRLELNPETGYVKRFFDKLHNMEIFEHDGCRLTVLDDKTDTWSHDTVRFDTKLADMKLVSVRLYEQGAVRATLRVKYQFHDSYVTQDFRMYHDLDQVEVKLVADWHEPQTALKVVCPVSFIFRTPTLEAPFGYIEKTNNGQEEPGQNWIDFSGVVRDTQTYGLSIANDAKYSFSFDNKEMAIMVLRNPVFAHHDPTKLDPDTDYEYVDQGRQEFTYALLGHSGGWKSSPIVRLGQELNQKATAIIETYHTGTLPQSQSFFSVEKPQIIISALKQAEDGDGIILRAYESTKQPVTTTIALPFLGRELTLNFTPCEIKTIKIPYDIKQGHVEVSMTEWSL